MLTWDRVQPSDLFIFLYPLTLEVYLSLMRVVNSLIRSFRTCARAGFNSLLGSVIYAYS